MRRFRLALWATFLVWGFVLFWLGGRTEPFWKGYAVTGRQNDYYNLLVEGFLKGQLSLNHAVDPDLLSADPRVRHRADFLLDAAVYRGKYYIYYGVTPAILLLLPYRLVTGNELGLGAAGLVFALGGLAISAGWLLELRRRLRADWGPGMAVFGVTVLAAVPGSFVLVRGGSYNTLPVVAGYACVCALWAALFRAAAAPRPFGWIAAASVFLGLAVGCRPNLILIAPLVAVGAAVAVRRRRGLALTLAAAAGPACGVGALLAWYNQARFGDPLDFGFSHGLNSFFGTGRHLVDPAFLPANLSWYLATPPAFAPRFPFEYAIGGHVVPAGYGNVEAMGGFLAVTLLAVWTAGWLAAAARRGAGVAAEIRPWLALFAGAAGVELIYLCLLGIRADRYAADFLSSLALALVLGAASWWHRPGWSGRLARVGGGVFALAAATHLALSQAGTMQFARPREFAWWSSHNPTQATMERLGTPAAGAVEFTVTFAAAPRAPVVVPLLATGVASDFDSVRATLFPNGYLSLTVFHAGFGGPSTGLIPVEWGRPYRLQVSMGSLFPARTDPFFVGWTAGAVDRAKLTGWVALDGRTVIQRRMAFFEGTPGTRAAGYSGVDTGEAGFVPGMTLTAPRVIAAPEFVRTETPRSPALYVLHTHLLAVKKSREMPLLSSGVTAHGSLLFFDPQPSGHYRLAVDEWGFGLLAGPSFDGDESRLVTLAIVVGPALRTDPDANRLLSDQHLRDLQERLLVWCDGALIGNFHLTHQLDSFDQLLIGHNDAGFTSSAAEYIGELRRDQLTDADRGELLRRALATPAAP